MNEASTSLVLSIVALVISGLALLASFWNALTNALNRRDKRRMRLTMVGRVPKPVVPAGPDTTHWVSEWTLHNAGEATVMNPNITVLGPDEEPPMYFAGAGALPPGQSLRLSPVGHLIPPTDGFRWQDARADVLWLDGRRRRKARATVTWDFS